MKGFIGVTDSDWIAHLRATGQTEANFWLPSPRTFRALQPGQPFLFKTHYPDNRIVGGGFFADSFPLRASEAWECFGQANGVASLDDLVDRVGRYRRGEVEDNPWIGTVILDDVMFFDDAVELAPPRSFAKNIVQGKGYQLDGPDVDSDAERLFGLLMAGSEVAALAAGAVGADAEDHGGVAAVVGPVFGDPTVARRRLGQGAFKALVMHSYDRRCAITGHKIAPTLQAAHIKPVSRGGENRVDNGLLLRSDVHTMFDRGYLGIDTAHRLRVSPRLREEFGNGEEFYAREGTVILLPERTPDRPAREFLEWHSDEIFLAG